MFTTGNDLRSLSQPGLKPRDSCTKQSISIIHNIYSSFDEGLEVKGVFVDITKTFRRVWQKDLFLKLK